MTEISNLPELQRKKNISHHPLVSSELREAVFKDRLKRGRHNSSIYLILVLCDSEPPYGSKGLLHA